jgi:hypothetical protein
MSAEPEAVFCSTHPKVETYLRCGRCDTPICPRCLIQTPVGARCRACARLRRLPIYDVGPRLLLRGAAAGLAAATFGGSIVFLAMGFLPFLIGVLIVGALFGYGVSEVVSLAANRRRGASLFWTTAVALVLGLGLGSSVLLYIGMPGGPELVHLARALAIGFSLDFRFLALLGVAGLIAYNRLR